MLAIKGNELSTGHHRGSWINVVPGDGSNLDGAFQYMTDIDGLGAFFHPGRYWDIRKNYVPGEMYSPEWYQNYYLKYPAIVAMEVFNHGEIDFRTTGYFMMKSFRF
jgi:hypothetical protein